jgi:hypothetical protein
MTIEKALKALNANVPGNMHKYFHSLQSLVAGNSSTEGWITNWLNHGALEGAMHHLSTLSGTEVGDSTRSNSLGNLSLLMQSGLLLFSFSFEHHKHSIVSRVSRWLALSALCYLYTWMTADTGCKGLSAYIYGIVKQCNASNQSGQDRCRCGSQSTLISVLCQLAHHAISYLLLGMVDHTKRVPAELTSQLVRTFKLPPSIQLYTDIRVGKIPTRPDPKRPERMQLKFHSLFRLLLEQIFVYPHSQSLLSSTGAGSPLDAIVEGQPCPESFTRLREHVIAVGGICSQLQGLFGSTVIFSLCCDNSWEKLVRNPSSFFFLDSQNSRARASHSLAQALQKNEGTVMKSVVGFVDQILSEEIDNSELLVHCTVSIFNTSHMPSRWG